jgi:two-component system response regulator MprA
MSTHILVVDDDTHLTSALRRTLSYEGYQVLTVADGEKALEQVRLKPPDLVILDLMLPGIGGLEVCHRLRATHEYVAVLCWIASPVWKQAQTITWSSHLLLKNC